MIYDMMTYVMILMICNVT